MSLAATRRPASGRSTVIAISASRREIEKARGTGTSSMTRPGWRSVSRQRRGARKAVPKPSGAPTRTVPERATSAPSISARASIIAASMRSAFDRKVRPRSVNSHPFGRRCRSFAPIAASRLVSRRPTVAWFNSSRRAADRIWPARATARKTRTSSQFMRVPPFESDERGLRFLHNGFAFQGIGFDKFMRQNGSQET